MSFEEGVKRVRRLSRERKITYFNEKKLEIIARRGVESRRASGFGKYEINIGGNERTIRTVLSSKILPT